jgi:hypothetical protein
MGRARHASYEIVKHAIAEDEFPAGRHEHRESSALRESLGITSKGIPLVRSNEVIGRLASRPVRCTTEGKVIKHDPDAVSKIWTSHYQRCDGFGDHLAVRVEMPLGREARTPTYALNALRTLQLRQHANDCRNGRVRRVEGVFERFVPRCRFVIQPDMVGVANVSEAPSLRMLARPVGAETRYPTLVVSPVLLKRLREVVVIGTLRILVRRFSHTKGAD